MMRLNNAFNAPLTSSADLVVLDSRPVDSEAVPRKSILRDACKSQWYWAESTPQRLRKPPIRRVTAWEYGSRGTLPMVQFWPAMTALKARATALTSEASVSF